VRVDQLVPGFAQHDAISNHVLQVRRTLRGAGYESDIYGEWIDPRLAGEGARPFADCSAAPDRDRVLLYHESTHSPMATWLRDVAGAGQLIATDYHNITPSRYFARWEPPAARSMDLARQEVELLASCTGLAVADSPYNEAELIDLGYSRTAVCPLLVDLEDYHREPDRKTLARLARQRQRGGRRWLFVGRVSPNKCQHDVIAAFAVYRRLFDPLARLTLVGGVTSPRYLRALQQMATQLELGDSVEFPEATPFSQLLAYFRASDVFVCLSEHEGFCVPILEAMELGLPVVAYRAAAVTDTVAAAGILLDDKDPLAVAVAVDDLLSDDPRRADLVEAGRSRAGDFSLARNSRQLLDTLTAWLSSVSAGA
jgi:glycosyltransferase involved in cell wall biosynthesis